MIPLIGLIVGVYSLIRCLTIPLEIGQNEGKIAGVGPMQRFWMAVVICGIGGAILLLLTALLLLSGSSIPTR